MLLACCPGGTTSNLFTHLGKGNLALSVALTTFSSLAVIITMPIILSISSELIFNQVREFDIPQLEILKRLFFMTILPIMIGIFISYRFPKLGKFISSKTGAFGLVFLIFLTGTVVINECVNCIGCNGNAKDSTAESTRSIYHLYRSKYSKLCTCYVYSVNRIRKWQYGGDTCGWLFADYVFCRGNSDSGSSPSKKERIAG